MSHEEALRRVAGARKTGVLPLSLKHDPGPGLEERWVETAAENRFTGAELRARRNLPEEKGPEQEWGSLTPEGHWLWLRDHHARQFRL